MSDNIISFTQYLVDKGRLPNYNNILLQMGVEEGEPPPLKKDKELKHANFFLQLLQTVFLLVIICLQVYQAF